MNKNITVKVCFNAPFQIDFFGVEQKCRSKKGSIHFIPNSVKTLTLQEWDFICKNGYEFMFLLLEKKKSNKKINKPVPNIIPNIIETSLYKKTKKKDKEKSEENKD
jgi:hypothetical protein